MARTFDKNDIDEVFRVLSEKTSATEDESDTNAYGTTNEEADDGDSETGFPEIPVSDASSTKDNFDWGENKGLSTEHVPGDPIPSHESPRLEEFHNSGVAGPTRVHRESSKSVPEVPSRHASQESVRNPYPVRTPAAASERGVFAETPASPGGWVVRVGENSVSALTDGSRFKFLKGGKNEVRKDGVLFTMNNTEFSFAPCPDDEFPADESDAIVSIDDANPDSIWKMRMDENGILVTSGETTVFFPGGNGGGHIRKDGVFFENYRDGFLFEPVDPFEESDS